MIKGISHWALAQGEARPIPQGIEDARKAGFGALEAAVGLTGSLRVDTPREECRELRAYIAGGGVAVESVATSLGWKFSLTHIDPLIRKRGVELQRQAMERAAWLGARDFLLVPGAVTILWDKNYPPVPYDRAVGWAGEAVAALLPVADDLGITICIENVWNGLFYSPIELVGFVDQFGGKVGVYFDIGNVLGCHQWPPHWIALLGARIRRIHVKDFRLDVGGLAGFVPLLKGDVPWAACMAALRGVGYDKTVIAEVEGGSDAALAGVSEALDIILGMTQENA